MIDCTNIKDWNKYWWIFLLLFGGIISCSPRSYPIGKPYVYKSNVSLKANIPSEQRKAIEVELQNYLDDSLKVVNKSVLNPFSGFKKQINPPVFDSANIDRSKGFMKNYLNSLGFYRAVFDTVKVKYDFLPKNEIRTTVSFFIDADKQLKFDSIWYDLKVPELQTLAIETKGKSIMKKGEGYSKQVVGQELDRLVSLYRNKGYFKITRNSLVAEFDSTDDALINLDKDPFLLIQQAKQRRLNPTVDFKIFQRPDANSSDFLKYQIGKVTIYPETKIDEDQTKIMADKDFLSNTGKRGVIVKYKKNLFTVKTVRRFNSLLPGNFYNEEQYFKTFNAYSQVGSWQQVDAKTHTYIDSADSIPKVDINLFLTPAKKFSVKADLEGSQNIGRNAVDALTGSFFGVSLVGNLLNRNFVHNAIQWNSNIRGGVEINTKNSGNGNSGIFQTTLFSASTTFSIPRLWPPFKSFVKRADAARTFINLNAGYNDRRNFYQLRNLNTSLGYEWKKKNNVWTIKIPNIEFVDLVPSDSLSRLIQRNPNLFYSFNQGLVLGVLINFQKDIFYRKKTNNSSYFRITAEESGAFMGDSLFKGKMLRFWKLDGEFRHNIILAKHKWAFRLIGGYGRDYTSSTKPMPFFRQFIAGGPNSMRAWRLRQLGLGNSFMQDTAQVKDRLGDIYLEANAEYRFHLFKILGFPIEGAFFTDIGNIWSRTSINETSGDGVLTLKNLYRDLAVAGGFGIRWDFSYLRVRFDFAYKMKDPVRGGNGWLKRFEYKTPNRIGTLENKNYALQFGIDYPF